MGMKDELTNAWKELQGISRKTGVPLAELLLKHYLQKIGSTGGKKRARTLTAKKRKQIAKRAARARWRKK